jgi:catechol 2,3-dioxygenase-like lactoylglutathione lyase family enzyme
MNRVKVITVLVLDQDATIEFYTRKLGFELREDKPFGESRWVTILQPKNSDLTLAPELAKTADDKAIVGKQGSFSASRSPTRGARACNVKTSAATRSS